MPAQLADVQFLDKAITALRGALMTKLEHEL
jgi:hypothetical protein